MALIIGDLTVDPSATSFIALADARAYLSAEGNAALSDIADDKASGALVASSRWLASAFYWNPLTADNLVVVGQIAARLAAVGIGEDFFAGLSLDEQYSQVSVGPVAVTYRTDIKVDTLNKSFPWLRTALRGLIRSRDGFIGAMVV